MIHPSTIRTYEVYSNKNENVLITFLLDTLEDNFFYSFFFHIISLLTDTLQVPVVPLLVGLEEGLFG